MRGTAKNPEEGTIPSLLFLLVARAINVFYVMLTPFRLVVGIVVDDYQTYKQNQNK